jgi:hypothetical protein
VTPDYQPVGAVNNLVACSICAAVVEFGQMTIHTRWHEVMEPAWPLSKNPPDAGPYE